MHFRIRANLNVYLPRPGKSMNVIYHGITPIEVHVYSASSPSEGGNDQQEPLAVASTVRRDHPWLVEAFVDLSENRFPIGSLLPEGIEKHQQIVGQSRGWRCEFEWLPPRLQQLLDEISRELNSAVRDTVQIARWRTGEKKHPDPLKSTRGLEWSRDGGEWRSAPLHLHARLEVAPKLRISDGLEEEVQRMLLKHSVKEPLAHQLLKESQDLSGRNRATSLVIGIAALEAGVKQLLTHLVPDVTWLVENTQSPPVVLLLSEYVPRVLFRLKLRSSMTFLPDGLIKDIRDGIATRNKIVHGIHSEVTEELLDRVLMAIEDILWTFDFYNGNHWAANFVRNSTRETLQLLNSSTV